jgi:hypothetical protein
MGLMAFLTLFRGDRGDRGMVVCGLVFPAGQVSLESMWTLRWLMSPEKTRAEH